MDYEKIEKIEKIKGKKIGNKGEEGKLLECQHCSYLWIYTGNRDKRTNCPKCGYKVNISRREIDTSKYEDMVTYDLLDQMEGGLKKVRRYEKPDIHIQKNRVLGREGLKPKFKDEYLIYEKKFLGSHITLNADDLKGWEEEANRRDLTFEELVQKKIDSHKGGLEKLALKEMKEDKA